jgi:integrase
MASLTKDSKGRSPYWIACYTAADGRQLKKSTKQTDRKKALEVSLALERAEDLAKKGTLTETRTRELLAEVLERTTGETLPFFTAEGFLRDWLNGKEVSKAASTFINYSQTVNSFLAHLGKRAKLSIAAITPKDVSTFRDVQIASGKNPNSVRVTLKHLRVPFNAARRQGIIITNPAEAVELPTATKNEDGSDAARHIFTPEQIVALLDATVARENGKPVFDDGKDWQGAILFAYYTGARIADTANITWSAIDLPTKMLTFRPQKTKKEVKIPIHPELEAHLLEMSAPDSGRAFVFPKLAGKKTSMLSRKFADVMEHANIENPVLTAAKGSKGRTVYALSFHSLRHSFNSAMANAGVSQEIRMKLTGHSDAATNKGYTHHELAPLRAAINSIPSPIQRKAAQ